MGTPPKEEKKKKKRNCCETSSGWLPPRRPHRLLGARRASPWPRAFFGHCAWPWRATTNCWTGHGRSPRLTQRRKPCAPCLFTARCSCSVCSTGNMLGLIKGYLEIGGHGWLVAVQRDGVGVFESSTGKQIKRFCQGGAGNGKHQLRIGRHCAVDVDGRLFVADSVNHRRPGARLQVGRIPGDSRPDRNAGQHRRPPSASPQQWQ